MNAVVIEVILIMTKLRREITFIPKQSPISKFAVRTANLPFYEGVTPGTIRYRLNLIDTVLLEVG